MRCYLCESENLHLERNIDDSSYYRCKNCNLLQQVPIPDVYSVDERYKNGKEYFNDLEKGVDYAEGEGFFKKTSIFYYTFLNNYLTKRDIKICDFGASTGFFINFLRTKGFVRVEGIEPSYWASTYGIEKYGVKIYNDKIENIQNLGRYDIFTCFHVIEHLPDPKKIFKYIHDHINGNGLMMLATPNSKNLTIKLVGNKWKHFLPNEHLYLFDSKSIEYFLRICGFEILEIHKCLYENISLKKYLGDLIHQILKYNVRLILSKFGLYDSQKLKRIKFLTNRDGIIVIARKI